MYMMNLNKLIIRINSSNSRINRRYLYDIDGYNFIFCEYK